MLRMTTAFLALTLMAGAAYAAPNDATSETDAIELDQNTLPGGNEPSAAMGAEPNSGGSNDYENRQLEQE